MNARCVTVLICVVLFTATFVTDVFAQKSNPEFIAVFAPKPEYPNEARAKSWGGSGVVLLNVDTKKGLVISARMLKSTGHKVLDDAALNSFRQWRFKPGASAPKVEVPITFTTTGTTY